MPRRPKPTLIEAEVTAALEGFRAYMTRGRSAVVPARRDGAAAAPRPMRGERKPKALSPRTARCYAVHVRALMVHAQTTKPTPAQALEFQTWLVQHGKKKDGAFLASSSLRSSGFALQVWFEYQGTPIDPLPMPSYEKPGAPEHLTLEECRTLLSKVDCVRDYAMLCTFLYTGLRTSEVAALKVMHLDAERGILRIPGKVKNDTRAAAKRGKVREIAIAPRAVAAIQEYLATRPATAKDPEAPLFASFKTGDHLRGDSASDVVAFWSTRALGRRIMAHRLRHTFGVHAADDADGKHPMPLRKLQEQMGHENEMTTLRYVNAAKGGLLDSYSRAVPAF